MWHNLQQRRVLFPVSASLTVASRSTITLTLSQSSDYAWDASCVLCSQCFHSTNHPEAWRVPIGCPHHPPVRATPKIVARNMTHIFNPQPKSNQVVPAELLETMRMTVACALDLIPDILDYPRRIRVVWVPECVFMGSQGPGFDDVCLPCRPGREAGQHRSIRYP